MVKIREISSFLLITVFLGGCVASTGVSMDEAAKIALAESKKPIAEPNENLEELKVMFSDELKPDDCKEISNMLKEKESSVLKALKSRDPHSAAAEAAFVTTLNNRLGYSTEAVKFAELAYNSLPSSGVSTRAAVLASNITRIYAYNGNLSRSNLWSSKSQQQWSKAGTNHRDNSPMGVANTQMMYASLAYANGNLLAEEYFLKNARSAVWRERSSMKTSINAEQALSYLVRNLNDQGRIKEAEYTARIYLSRLKRFHNRRLNYPMLMNELARSFYLQERFEDAKWASERSLQGHKNICSNVEGLLFKDAQRNASKIKSALKG